MTASNRVLARSDCERCRDSRWLTQPANTVSSLAYAVVGVPLARHLRHRRRAGDTVSSPAGVALALTGLSLGSVAYHGPGGEAGRRAHDASIVAAVLFLAAGDVQAARGRPRPGPGHLAVSSAVGLVACDPRTSLAAQGVAGLAAAVADGMAWRASPPGSPSRRLRGAATGAWLVGALAQATGRTGGPLCRPEARFPVHAGWHVISALALALTVLAQAAADGAAPELAEVPR